VTFSFTIFELCKWIMDMGATFSNKNSQSINIDQLNLPSCRMTSMYETIQRIL